MIRHKRKTGPAVWKILLQRARQRVREDLGDRELPDPAEIIQLTRKERDNQLAGQLPWVRLMD